jgi:predicted RNA binding protein YcfA (HicA-like mRNA interferase family)
MTKWDKLIAKVLSLSKDMRFEELRRVLEEYGYHMKSPSGGSSHCTFRKKGENPITIPTHEPIKKVYVEMVKRVVMREGDSSEEEN